jgi:hypothetical protein
MWRFRVMAGPNALNWNDVTEFEFGYRFGDGRSLISHLKCGVVSKQYSSNGAREIQVERVQFEVVTVGVTEETHCVEPQQTNENSRR